MNLSIRKYVAAFSVMALIASFLVTAGVASAQTATDYDDVNGEEWFVEDVQWGLDNGILDSEQAYFRGGDNATRAEFTKMALLGAGLPEEACDETLFPDLDADHWGCGYITAAANAGIVSGMGAGHENEGYFLPNDTVLRAEAGKITVEAYGLEGTSLGSDVFTDVPVGEWYDEYMGSSWDNCVFQGVGGGNTVEPGRNIVRAEAIAVVQRGANPTDECHAAVETGALTVDIHGSTPESTAIPKNGANIPYAVFALSASADEDVRVEQLILTRKGLGLPGDFKSVKLYVDDVQKGSQKTVNTSTNTATFTLAGDPIVVPAGSTVLVTVKADMSGAENSQNAFCVSMADDVLGYGADSAEQVDVGGSFAVCGNYMTTTSAEVGTLTYEYDDYSGDINIGDTSISTAKLKLTADNTEDVDVTRITWRNNGSAGPEDFANMALYSSGVEVADTSTASWNDGYLTFDLSEDPIYISRGNSKTLELRTDVVGGIGSTVLFEIRRDWHIEATGLVYGYGVNVVETTSPPLVEARDIIGGKLAFAVSGDNPTVGDMLPDADDHEFLVFNVSTAGEGVTLNDYDVEISYDHPTLATLNPNTLQDVKIWVKNSADEWVNVGTLDPAAEDPVPAVPFTRTLSFTDSWDLPASTTTPFMITADGNSAPEGAEYKITFKTDSVDAEYAGGDKVYAADISGGDLEGNTQTVAEPTLDVSVASSPPAYSAPGDEQPVVGGTLDVEPINWNLTASSAADVTITSVTVTCDYQNFTVTDNTDCGDVFTGLELSSKSGSTYTPLDTTNFSAGDDNGGGSFESTAVFNNVNLTVPKGQTTKLALTANTTKSPEEGDYADFSLSGAGDVSAEYSEDSIVPTVDTAFTRVEFIGTGTLTVSVAPTTPASDSVIDGAEDVHVSTIRMTADQNEGILVQKLRLTNDYDGVCPTPADDSFAATVKITDGTTEYSGVLNGGTANFDFSSNPYLVPKDGNLSLEVWVDTNTITSSGPASGTCASLSIADVSGNYADYEAGLVDVKAVGASSGKALDGAASLTGGTGYAADLYTGGWNYFILRDNVPTFSLNENTPSGAKTGNAAQEVIRFDIALDGDGLATFDGLNFVEYGTSVTGSAGPYKLYWASTSGDQELATSLVPSFTSTEFDNSIGIELDGGTAETFFLKADTTGLAIDETLSFSLENITWSDGKAPAGSLDETDIDTFPVVGEGMTY